MTLKELSKFGDIEVLHTVHKSGLVLIRVKRSMCLNR